MRPFITVIGSLNIDLVVKCRERPRPGETVAGTGHRYVPGGKGANQAFAIGRMGGDVSLIGCIGGDPLGTILTESLKSGGVDLEPVTVLEDVPTGAAFITLDEKGENSIVVSGGANAMLTPDMVEAQREIIESSQMLVAQLETPLPAVSRALEIALSAGKQTVVNLTPVMPLPADSVLWRSAVLALNELEAEYYTGIRVRTEADAFNAGDTLLKRGAEITLITLGEQGSVAVSRTLRKHVSAVRVRVVDTTAAGDTYIGAFCTEWLRTGNMEDAMVFASHAAAICVSRFGAQTSIPEEREVRAFMASPRGG